MPRVGYLGTALCTGLQSCTESRQSLWGLRSVPPISTHHRSLVLHQHHTDSPGSAQPSLSYLVSLGTELQLRAVGPLQSPAWENTIFGIYNRNPNTCSFPKQSKTVSRFWSEFRAQNPTSGLWPKSPPLQTENEVCQKWKRQPTNKNKWQQQQQIYHFFHILFPISFFSANVSNVSFLSQILALPVPTNSNQTCSPAGRWQWNNFKTVVDRFTVSRFAGLQINKVN